MGQTIAEKIISGHVGKSVHQDAVTIAGVDWAMASDTTAPLAIKAFEAMGGTRAWDPDRCVLVIDHAAPAPNERIANLHTMMRRFAAEQKCILFDIGEGICHQLMVEKEIVRPGQLVIGADSHTCTYGAVGAMGVGVGSTDLAAVLLTGRIWLRVPRTIRVAVDGKLRVGVQAKDLILTVLKQTGVAGATYRALEFEGPAIAALPLSGRMTIANMAIEAGAKTGLVHPDGLQLPYEFEAVRPDADALYERTIHLLADELVPVIARPHAPDRVEAVDRLAGKRVHYAFIGTCVNGRLDDLHVAAEILNGGNVAGGTRLIIAPASRRVFGEAVEDGTVETLSAAGATFIPPGCGPCVGTHNGVPADGEVVISTGNRNFKGRMGNPRADIYLASAATVAASAREGRITNPCHYLGL
jgi:3-isopropylmalate/(R)-2-methylmalate dehydratase large subunit